MGLKFNIFVVLVSVIVAALWLIPLPIASYLLAKGNGLPPAVYSVDRATVTVESDPGIFMRTDRYFPKPSPDNKGEKFPTILVRVPYGIVASHSISGLIFSVQAYYFASQGYNYVLQGSRGKFESTGVYRPTYDEKRDGRATLKWLKNQDWFDGKLGLFGFSIGAYNTVASLGKDAPVQAKAVVPVMTPYNFFDEIHEQGSVDLNLALGWSLVMNDEGRHGLLHDYKTLATKSHPVMQNWEYLWNATMVAPVNKADQVTVNETISMFQNFVNNYERKGEFWGAQETYEGVADTNGDKFHIFTCWYDFLLNATMRIYEDKVAQGEKPYLSIYAQDHFGLGENFDTLKEALAWFNAKLKGEKTLLRTKPVQVQLMPSGDMLHFDSWPPATKTKTLYLSKAPSALADFQNELSGSLTSESDVKQGKFSYVYNPVNPTPIFKGNMLFHGGWGDNTPFLKQRQAENRDVLVFTGPALTDNRIVAGKAHVTLKVTNSLGHADYFVRLLDYNPAKNESRNVCEGFTRLTPDTLPSKAADDSFLAQVTLSPTFYEFQKGNQMMLYVSSGAHPRYSRNPGTGIHISSAFKFRPADNTVFTTGVSKIELPIYQK